MSALPNHTALKEWAAVVSALRSGDQIILVRKGGIADPSFGVEAGRFYLFPTYMHQKEKQFRSDRLDHFIASDLAEVEPAAVTIDTWCEVVEVYRVSRLDLLRRLEPFVIFTAETFEERYRFRPEQAVHVIAVRAHGLARPAEIVNRAEYAGCRSWVSLEEEIDVDGSTPALDDASFAARVAEIDWALSASS